MNIIGDWISKNQDWSKTMFTDKKRFTLDGPDDWRTWAPKKVILLEINASAKVEV